MILTDRQKNNIHVEYQAFKEKMYAGKTEKEREELAQFFTPAEISIKLIELYDTDTLAGKIIRDPCSGSGNLLAACIIAGADLDKVLGNDYDATMVKLCRERIRTVPDRIEQYDKTFADELRVKLNDFNDWQIHRGDARDAFCLTEFGPDYKDKLISHYYEDKPMAEILDPEHLALETWLSSQQVEFLKEVD